MKRGPSEFGLALAGLGLALATLVLDQAGVELPTWLLITLGVIAAAMIVGGLLPHSSNRETGGPHPDPCGDPDHRRADLTTSAKRLEGELARFPKVWWPAVSDPDFEGETWNHFRTNHAEAMQALLYAFAFFFSAAWIYEKQCKGHHGRRRKQVLDLVGEVYLALGTNARSDTDVIVNSLQILTIAERSTRHRGETRAQPMGVADFNTQLKDNPTFAAHFQPLKNFLMAADPDEDAGMRLAATQEAVKRVEEKLT